MTIPKHLQVENYETKTWTCKLCKKTVNKTPSECRGVEPVWWWWCDPCRVKHSSTHPASSEKKGIERFMYKQF